MPLLPLVLAQVPPVLREALALEGVPTCDYRDGDVGGRFVLFDRRRGRRPRIVRGQVEIDVDALRRKIQPDPFRALADERSGPQAWEFGELELGAEIARYDKRQIRRELMYHLRRSIESAGGVWLVLAAYPFPNRSAFALRIDHEDHPADDVGSLLQAVAGFEHATSHFVSGAPFEHDAEVLAPLRGLDVGSLGYRDRVFRSADENVTNIRRGIEVLQRAGFEPSGFAAPGGRYHDALRRAMEVLRITHSSEFGLVYDDLPQYPAGSRVLQIPVHPIGLGLFSEVAQQPSSAGALAADRAADYFARVAQAKYRAGEPLIFYGRWSRRLDWPRRVVANLLETVASCGALWRTNFTELAAWSRARREVGLQLFQSGGEFVVIATRRPAGYRLGVEFWRGEHVAPMPLDEPVLRFRPQMLAFQRRSPSQGPSPVRLDEAHRLRRRVWGYFDPDRAAPLAELASRTWRQAVTRTFRRWKG